jgi:hypothetical protein
MIRVEASPYPIILALVSLCLFGGLDGCPRFVLEDPAYRVALSMETPIVRPARAERTV